MTGCSCKSTDSQLNFGVPQDSALGPRMHTNTLKRNDFKYHCYADDTLVYMALQQGDNMDEAVHRI